MNQVPKLQNFLGNVLRFSQNISSYVSNLCMILVKINHIC